jgi:hypothetical protein
VIKKGGERPKSQDKRNGIAKQVEQSSSKTNKNKNKKKKTLFIPYFPPLVPSRVNIFFVVSPFLCLFGSFFVSAQNIQTSSTMSLGVGVLSFKLQAGQRRGTVWYPRGGLHIKEKRQDKEGEVVWSKLHYAAHGSGQSGNVPLSLACSAPINFE